MQQSSLHTCISNNLCELKFSIESELEVIIKSDLIHICVYLYMSWVSNEIVLCSKGVDMSVVCVSRRCTKVPCY
jgi:hypothetical protein